MCLIFFDAYQRIKQLFLHINIILNMWGLMKVELFIVILIRTERGLLISKKKCILLSSCSFVTIQHDFLPVLNVLIAQRYRIRGNQ